MEVKSIIMIVLLSALPCWPQTPARTINELPLPEGYTRINYPPGSYCHWIARLPLKSTTVIRIYDGRFITKGYYNVLAVVAMPLLFQQDLEQCADFSFRFWAEYHKQRNMLDKLYLFDYNGNKLFFKKAGQSFPRFLKRCMANSNSYSLKKGCIDVDSADARPGDMIVQNETGGIGHVSVIMDVCHSASGEKLYCIGFSFMPAQEFHIEKASPRHGRHGWYTFGGYSAYLHEYLDLGTPVLKRFKEQ